MENQTSDYSKQFLDQLHNAPIRSPKHRLIYFVIAGVVALGLMIFLIILANKHKVNLNVVIHDVKWTKQLAKDNHSLIENPDLRSTNAALQLTLTNLERDLANHQPNPKKIEAKKEEESIKKRLDDARLNALFDRSYSTEMIFKINTLLIDIEKIYNRTNDQALSSALKSNYDSLVKIKNQLEATKL